MSKKYPLLFIDSKKEESDVDLAVFGLKDELFYKAYAEVMNILSEFEIDLLDYKECRESFQKEINERGVEL